MTVRVPSRMNNPFSWRPLAAAAGALFMFSSVAASAQPAPAPAQPAAPGVAPQPGEIPPAREEELAVIAPEAGGLTADEVARRALRASHNVRARQAEVEAAEARIQQTGVQFAPRLTLKASYTRLSPVSSSFGSGALVGALNPGLLSTGPCPTGAGTCVLDSRGVPVGAQAFAIKFLEDNYALSATLSVPLSDYLLRLSDAVASSSASRRSAELSREAEKLRVESDARLAFYGWLRAKGRVAVAEKALERTRARLKDAETAFTLGTITKADLLRLRALVSNGELLVLEAQTGLEISERQLAIIMGEPPRTGYRVGEDVSAARSEMPLPASLEAAVSEALSRRYEAQSLAEASRASRRGAKAVKAGTLPRVDAIGDITYANPNPRYFPPTQEWHATWSIGVQATWTVGDAFLNSANADELEARARGFDAQRAALQDGIRQEVTASFLMLRRARLAVDTSRRALEAAQEAYRVATDLYRVGRATTTELIEAEGDLLNARLAELDARIEVRLSEERLRHSSGRDARR